MVFPEMISEKVDFEKKNQQTTKNLQNYPACVGELPCLIYFNQQIKYAHGVRVMGFRGLLLLKKSNF